MLQPDDLLFNDTNTHADQTEERGKPRAHLGASQIGKEDTRTLWFNFRWCLSDDFTPRTLRLFRLGNILENEIISILRKIPGVTVYCEDNMEEQFNFSELGGHFSGSVDGVITGLPESPKTPHLLECKSANKKQFDDLLKLANYSKWKAEYGGQVQVYMGALNLTRALACVYCKNDSRLYFERIKIDKMVFPAMIAKAERIITAVTPPESIWPNEQYYEARYLYDENQAIYWGKTKPANKHCRNCKHSLPIFEMENAAWLCQPMSKVLSIDEQLNGCSNHEWLECFEKI